MLRNAVQGVKGISGIVSTRAHARPRTRAHECPCRKTLHGLHYPAPAEVADGRCRGALRHGAAGATRNTVPREAGARTTRPLAPPLPLQSGTEAPRAERAAGSTSGPATAQRTGDPHQPPLSSGFLRRVEQDLRTLASQAATPAAQPSSPMSSERRCDTRAGAFRCDGSPGHSGPCETVQRPAPWVGPALAPDDVARLLMARSAAVAAKREGA